MGFCRPSENSQPRIYLLCPSAHRRGTPIALGNTVADRHAARGYRADQIRRYSCRAPRLSPANPRGESHSARPLLFPRSFRRRPPQRRKPSREEDNPPFTITPPPPPLEDFLRVPRHAFAPGQYGCPSTVCLLRGSCW